MNPHFKDARYYLGRTAAKLAAGVKTELEPVATTVRSRLGLVTEEPSRRELIEARLEAARDRVPETVQSVAADTRRKASGLRRRNRSA